MTNKLNWIDRTLLQIAPKFTAERLAWKTHVRTYYDSGNSERLNAGWTPINTTAEATNQGERDRIRSRARDLERNSDVAEAILSTFERNVISTGFRLQAKVLDKKGNDDETLNAQIEELFSQWCKAKNCDIAERSSFLEMQAMAMRRIKVDGGFIFIKSYQGTGNLPFCLQMREVDDIDGAMYSSGLKVGNRIINGIEVNEYNKQMAFWLRTTTPDGLYTIRSTRIDAKNVIYLNKLKRPSQIREISELAITSGRIRDINEFVEAVSIKERILACLSVFIKKITPSGTIGRGTGTVTTGKDGQVAAPTRTIAPGIISELSPGEDVQVVNPNGQATNAKEFIMFQQRLAGSGQGISYESVSRDLSQVNYSSARQGLLEDQSTYKVWQLFFIEKFLDEVYKEFIISAVITNQLDIKDFWLDKEKYLKHSWIAPGWSWIDPLKEVKANETALNTGQTTLAELSAQRGQDWKEVLTQLKKEKDYKDKLGLVTTTTGGTNNAGKTDTTAP